MPLVRLLRCFVLLWVGAATSVVFAQVDARFLPVVAEAEAPFQVTVDRPSWTYALGEVGRVRVSPSAAKGAPVLAVYTLGPEKFPGPEVRVTIPVEGLSIEVPSTKEPGFMRLILREDQPGSKPLLVTLGFSPEKIQPTQTEPADFDAFWAEQIKQLEAIPPDYQLRAAPELSNDKVETFFLSFQNVGNWSGPSRFHGVLCVPRAEGKFPVVLSVPGAGVRPYRGQRGLAAAGIITLDVGIHGIPVDLPPEVYQQLARAALSHYDRFQLDDRNAYYYRRVYLGCLRAARYLAEHPRWNGQQFIVQGGSQGGQLSLVTSVLEPRITGISCAYPAYADVTGYLFGRAGGWPGMFREIRPGRRADEPIEPKRITTTYYDSVNFARRVKVPGYYFLGYNDDVCPPTSIFAAYNVITAPKELTIAPEQGHRTSAEQQRLINEWVKTQVAVGGGAL